MATIIQPETPTMPVPSLRLILVCVCSSLALGCGGPEGPPTVPVSGRVTFAQAAPPAPGKVYFTPITVAEGLPRQPGSGTFNEQGEYQVTSYEENDGLVPGTYAVKIECWKKSSGYMDERKESYVPRNFQAEELVVAADDEPKVYDIDVPK